MRSDAHTTEDFVNRGTIVHNGYYTYPTTIYLGQKKKVEIMCPEHGIYEQRPDIHLRGGLCYKCGKKQMGKKSAISFEKMKERAIQKHEDVYDYSLITDYTVSRREYNIVCKKHGIFSLRFDHHIEGKGCQKCGVERRTKLLRVPQEDILERMNSFHGGVYEYPDLNYKNGGDLITILCKEHGEFEKSAHNHSKGSPCPKCCTNYSRAELEMLDFLKKFTKVKHMDRKIIAPYEIDIFLPEFGLAIEYDGLYFHSDKFLDSNYHLDKTNKIKEKGFRTIHIFEDEWVFKKHIVESRILNLIKKTEKTIYARNTQVREVTTREVTDFLNNNHIQGATGSSVKLGLYLGEELVSLMTFGGLRKNVGSSAKEGYYEMIRFCNLVNTNVTGGASKLLKYFIDNYSPENIISYADRRWSEGELYQILGFTLVKETKPNYFYTKNLKRENRFKYQKNILVSQGHDKNKTEEEIMSELGYRRIYDCGSLKYELKLKK